MNKENIDTSSDVVKTNDDPLHFEEFAQSELAIDIIATMLGFNTNEILEEKMKSEPNTERMAALKIEQKHLMDERKQIYWGNKDVMDECIKKYAPIIRARYEKK